jgi:Tfp pilus assembly protein PilN
MRAVNLLPRQQVEQASTSPTNTVAAVAAAGGLIVVVVLSAGFLLANRSVHQQRQALADAKAQLAVTPASTVSAQTQAKRAALLSERERRALALASALSKRTAWDRVLRRITLVLPNDVWLTSLNGTTPLTLSATGAPVPAPATTTPNTIPAAATALTVQGYTYSQDGVARLLSRLSVVPDLKNVQLQTSKTATLGGQNVINFTIVSDIRTGRDAA